jgi:hypothetical protein
MVDARPGLYIVKARRSSKARTKQRRWVLIAAVWVLYAEPSGAVISCRANSIVRIAYSRLRSGLIAFGLSLSSISRLTAPLVPNWLPKPGVLGYAAEFHHLHRCGLAPATELCAAGALGAAANITLITVLVWGPMVAAGGLTPMHFQETIVSCALTAASWVLASGSPPATAARLFPSRKRRSAPSGSRQ